MCIKMFFDLAIYIIFFFNTFRLYDIVPSSVMLSFLYKALKHFYFEKRENKKCIMYHSLHLCFDGKNNYTKN